MSNRVQKWTVGPERRKERETFCGRFGKRTPFLRLRAQLHRIRGRTLRTESLDRINARDLEQVVRLLREVDVSPVSPSSTTGCEEKRLEAMTVRRLAARDCLQSCGLTSKGLSLCFSELNYTGCETSRSEMDRWTGTPEGTRNESCGRFGKRTPFLRWRAQLYRTLSLKSPSSTTECEEKRSEAMASSTKPLRRST